MRQIEAPWSLPIFLNLGSLQAAPFRANGQKFVSLNNECKRSLEESRETRMKAANSTIHVAPVAFHTTLRTAGGWRISRQEGVEPRFPASFAWQHQARAPRTLPEPAAAKLAFCVTDLDAGGAERALVQLATRLDRTVWLPKVFNLSVPGALVEPLVAAGVPVESLCARGRRDVRVLPRLCRGLREFQPRLVQTWLFHGNLAGRLAARFCGLGPVVSGIRVAEQRKKWHLRLDRWTNRLVRINVAVSQAVAQFSINSGGLEPGKVVVIPNGVDCQLFATAEPADLRPLGIPPGSRVLVSVGRLDEQKGTLDLVACAAEVLPQCAGVHWLLLGEGPLRTAAEREIARRGLVDRVHLAGWRHDVPNLLRACHALVHAARWEGMPNAILEAMAAGLPVVATNVEGVAELVVAGQTGALVDPAAPGQLARATAQLLANPAVAEAWGKAGQARVGARFTWQGMANSYQSLYRELVEEHESLKKKKQGA
jgi:glycosyltransferase involved in cell wall biosynthesis